MNTAEHIVESYFRLCRGCFTLADRKVTGGNNRQMDLLAYNLKENTQFHVEVTVTHQLGWCEDSEGLHKEFDRKFFGVPPERDSESRRGTDSARGASYLKQIDSTYCEVGFSPKNVIRIWVCWVVKGREEDNSVSIIHRPPNCDKEFSIEVLSFRNCILPELTGKVGTANYDDEVLRTLSLIRAWKKQAQDS